MDKKLFKDLMKGVKEAAEISKQKRDCMTVYGKGGIEVKRIEDSINDEGVRLTTLQLKFHRFVLPEFNTHRVFSRNAASSRAIPVKKMIQQVWSEPAMPTKMQANQRGMQSSTDLGPWKSFFARVAWKTASKLAASMAWVMNKVGVHKQWTNRILEPFQFIHVVVTATDWDNFFWLRDHEDAQPEIRELAVCMRKAMKASDPKTLYPGEWHLPYVNHVVEKNKILTDGEDLSDNNISEILRKISVARCARVSYRNHDKSEPDIIKDLKLYDMLVVQEPPHASPAEHQATPMDTNEAWPNGMTHKTFENERYSGNFRSWIQFRQILLDSA